MTTVSAEKSRNDSEGKNRKNKGKWRRISSEMKYWRKIILSRQLLILRDLVISCIRVNLVLRWGWKIMVKKELKVKSLELRYKWEIPTLKRASAFLLNMPKTNTTDNPLPWGMTPPGTLRWLSWLLESVAYMTEISSLSLPRNKGNLNNRHLRINRLSTL